MKKIMLALMAVLFLGSTTGLVMADTTTTTPATKTHKGKTHKGHKGGKKSKKGMESNAPAGAAPATAK